MLYVAVKAKLSAAFPIATLIIVNSRPPAQQAKELVSRGMNHNSYMSMPDDQIGRFRMRHWAEFWDTVIQIVGIRIRIGKSGALVNSVHQVRAIASWMASLVGAQRYGDH